MNGNRAEPALGNAAASPFLKWAGGKGQLLRQIEPLLPARFGRYIEPFVGSGALFFHLLSQGRIADGAVLNDFNPELMTCYRVLQDEASRGELAEAGLDRINALTPPPVGDRVRPRRLRRRPDHPRRHPRPRSLPGAQSHARRPLARPRLPLHPPPPPRPLPPLAPRRRPADAGRAVPRCARMDATGRISLSSAYGVRSGRARLLTCWLCLGRMLA